MDMDDEIPDAGLPDVDPLWGHPYLDFPAGSAAQTRCGRLRRMRVGGHVAIDWPLLEELTEADRARDIIGVETPWSRLFQLNAEESYRELTVEFLSSFVLQQRPEGWDPDQPFQEVQFRLAGHQFQMTRAEFAVHSGLYTAEELETDIYTEGIEELPRSTLVSFWMAIATRPFGRSSQKVSCITDPLYRYLHRIIASSIVPRHFSRDKVNTSDLFFLYCLLMGRTCALADCLATYFATAHHRQLRGLLYGGANITTIARSLGIVPEEDPHLSPAITSTTCGEASVLSMRMVRRFPGIGLRFRDAHHEIFVPGVLPAPEDIPPFVEVMPGVPAPQQPVPQPPPDEPVPAPQQPQPQPGIPPQYPQHIYEDLPPAVRVVAQDFDRRLRRHERMLDWTATVLQQIAAALGVQPPALPQTPPPPPPEGDQHDGDPDQGQ